MIQAAGLRRIIEKVMERPEWSRSRAAYSQYVERPATGRLFEVFNECVSSSQWWRDAEPTLEATPFQLFEEALSGGDFVSAQDIAGQIFCATDDHASKGALRSILAARAILVHEAVAAGDAIVLSNSFMQIISSLLIAFCCVFVAGCQIVTMKFCFGVSWSLDLMRLPLSARSCCITVGVTKARLLRYCLSFWRLFTPTKQQTRHS